MFVPATNMTKNNLKVFDNITGKDNNYKLLDVSLYTSAAEFYFPVLNDNGDAITDGGIRECSPIVTTVTGIKNKLGIEFKDMDVFVFGVGQAIDAIDCGCGSYNEVKKWGVIDWITKFVVPDITNSNISMSKFWG
jgi:patatin-like phospholipase/acyl hydrolase